MLFDVGANVDYSKLEEALMKDNLIDVKTGITTASKFIDQRTMDAELYLLHAKLSFKTVRESNLKQLCSHVHFYLAP